MCALTLPSDYHLLLSPSLTEPAAKEKHSPNLKEKDMEKVLDRKRDGVTDIIRLFA
jgi:hypothetical protein